jgi:hypothetical protein
MEHYYAFVYVRILQALGAYGFRGFYERKAHFLQSVPYALKNLRWLASQCQAAYGAAGADGSALNGACSASEKLQGLASSAEGLTVRIFSFSFHRQMPADEAETAADLSSMRAVFPIPAAKNSSATLTGKDAPGDRLSQSAGERAPVSCQRSVARGCKRERSYQRRGFKNLMVSFGCTGGQHRSVYLAEQLARSICGPAAGWKWWSAISSWKRWNWEKHRADEGDDPGRRPGHAPAAAHQRPSQGAGNSRRPHAAGDRSLPPARLWRARGDCQRASSCGR